MMKVLFLDIDGVVNCVNTGFFNKLWPLDRYMAFLVGKIQLDTDCKVVLSSSWRHHPDGRKAVEESVVPIFDVTPEVSDSRQGRGAEIQAWLDVHPEVERYAILDDDADMLQTQLSNFFQTMWLTGLTPEIAEQVTTHLNGLH
jgi:hypothetical protein